MGGKQHVLECNLAFLVGAFDSDSFVFTAEIYKMFPQRTINSIQRAKGDKCTRVEHFDWGKVCCKRSLNS